LPNGCFREQRDHKVLQRDHADAKLSRGALDPRIR
jgi:hypothetical protein